MADLVAGEAQLHFLGLAAQAQLDREILAAQEVPVEFIVAVVVVVLEQQAATEVPQPSLEKAVMALCPQSVDHQYITEEEEEEEEI
jgi:hypothetical protein